MSGASIEATLESWASSLREVKRRMRPLFTQERVARSAEHFLDGLLGEERRKSGWMRAESTREAISFDDYKPAAEGALPWPSLFRTGRVNCVDANGEGACARAAPKIAK
jgi:hypothetical protein